MVAENLEFLDQEGPQDAAVTEEVVEEHGEAVAQESGETEAPPATEQEPTDYDPGDPAERTPEQRAGLRQALKAQKDRRKEAERQLAELQGRLSVLEEQRQQQQPQTPQPSDEDIDDEYWTDPRGYQHKLVSGVESRLRVQLSEQMVKATHDDYADVVEVFKAKAKDNPALVAQMMASPNPAQYAYDTGKQIKAIGEAKSFDEIRANIEAELRPQIEADLRKKYALDSAAQATTTSASARSASGNSPGPDYDSMSVNEILKGVNNQF